MKAFLFSRLTHRHSSIIAGEDFITSVADALQHISYFHPRDYVQALAEAHRREESPAARDAIGQLLPRSRLCAEGRRPICQDTGIVVVFLSIGMDVRWETDLGVEEMVNEAVRRAYRNPDNLLRASMVADPAGARTNTGDNTPAIVHTRLVPGHTVEVKVAAKGGGSEHKAAFAYQPFRRHRGVGARDGAGDGCRMVSTGILGIGIGGSAERRCCSQGTARPDRHACA